MDKADANTSVNRNARKTSFVTRYNNESGTTEDLSFPYPIKKVASHDHTTLFLTNNGDVYGLGINKLAQIDEDSTTISQVEISNATDIAVMLKVLILREDNVLLGCGRNANHALGFEHTYNVENLTVIPSTVYNNEKILFVGAGRAFSLVITARSNVYLMGQNWLDSRDNNARASILFSIPHVTANGHIVSLHCASFHIGILNSAGEVFLGGDNQHCKLGIGNNSNRAGFWKLDSSFLFSSISLFDDSTVLVTKDGDLLLLGHIGGNTITRKRNPLTRREKLHSVCHVSGYRASMVVSTNDGEIYLYVANTEGKVLLGNSDRDYDALVSCRADATLVCLSEKKTSKVTAHFHLLLMTMRRTELHDIDLVVQ